MLPRGRPFLVLLALLALAAFALAWAPARAEHEPGHRYFVVGTVTNDLGEPLCGYVVRAADTDLPSADSNRTATTDGAGYYHIQLHMHSHTVEPTNNNEGDAILVTVEGTGVSATRLADPNAANADGWGQQTVDLTVPDGKGRCPNLALYGGVAIAVVLPVVGAVWFYRRPRRAARGSRDLVKVSGVTRQRARELGKAGVRSVKDLAVADPEELSKATNLSPKQARLFVKRAQELQESKG